MNDSGWRSTGAAVPDAKVHDIDEGRHVVVVDFPFDTLDAFRTDWRPGVWDDSLRSWNPPMVDNHNGDLLIGATQGTERLPSAQRMIGRFSRFDDQAPWTSLPGLRYQQTVDGEIPGWSFHYQRAKSEPHRSIRGARSFVKAHMAEWGPTPFPAIPGALAVGVRSQEDTIMTTSPDTLRDMFRSGEINYDGYRSLMEESFPELAGRMNWDGIRAATVQSLPHGSGTSLYHEPANPPAGPRQRPEEHQHELGSRPTGAPTLDQILMLRDKGEIDDDGKKALIAKYYPHLADHFRSAPPKSLDDVRSVLTKAYGEEAARAIVISMPKAGGSVSNGSPHDDDGDGDDEAVRELVQMIDAALSASEEMSEGDGADDDEKRSTERHRLRATLEAAHVAVIELADIVGAEVGKRSDRISDEAWDGDASRFTPEQYRSSALIDTGEGKEDSKDRYRLPVREPDGTLNRKAVHAAAGSLAGAREALSGVSDEQRRSAARKLVSLYGQLGEKPTPTILRLAGKGDEDGGRSDGELVDPDAVEGALTRLERRRQSA